MRPCRTFIIPQIGKMSSPFLHFPDFFFPFKTHTAHQSCATAARCKKTLPPKPTKNFPIRPRHSKKRTKSSLESWRGLVGKFRVGQGGLEGRETPPKGGSFSLQGLTPSPSDFSPSKRRTAQRSCGGGRARFCERRRRRESRNRPPSCACTCGSGIARRRA